MRLAAVVEVVVSIVLGAWTAWMVRDISGSSGLGLGELSTLSLLVVFLAVLVVDVAAGNVIPAWIISIVARLRRNARSAPFRLGPLRLWNPEFAGLTFVFASSAVLGVLRGGIIGIVTMGVALVGGVASFVLSLEPSASRPRPFPWWLRLSRLSPHWVRELASPIARVLMDLGFEGTTREAESLAASTLFLGLSTCLAMGSVGLALAPSWAPLFFAAPLVASIAGFLVSYWARSNVLTRNARVDLPFLALAASLAARAGYPVEWAASRLAPDLPTAGYIARKGSESYKSHPSPELREMLRGYFSVIHSGGDVGRYLESWVGRGLEGFRSWLDQFIGSMSGFSEAILASASLGLAIGVVGSLLPGGSPDLIPMMAVMVVTITVLGVGLAHAKAPPLRDRYDDARWLLYSTSSGVVILLGASYAGLPLWGVAASGLLAFSLVYGLAWRVQRRIIELEEQGLIEALEVAIEARRLGLPLLDALVANQSVNPVAWDKLQRLRARASSGREADWGAGWRSWLARVTMRILHVAEEAGSTLPVHLELMLRTVREYRRARLEARCRLGRSLVVAIIAPPVVVFIISFLQELSGRLSSLGGLIQPVDSYYFDLARAAAVALALGLAALSSKLSDYTVRNTLRIATTVSATILAAIVSGPVVSALMGA